MPQDDEFQKTLHELRAVMAKKNKPCPVTDTIMHGEGVRRCALEEGHEGEHMCMYTQNSAYLRRPFGVLVSTPS
jgi:hypothetical protein